MNILIIGYENEKLLKVFKSFYELKQITIENFNNKTVCQDRTLYILNNIPNDYLLINQELKKKTNISFITHTKFYNFQLTKYMNYFTDIYISHENLRSAVIKILLKKFTENYSEIIDKYIEKMYISKYLYLHIKNINNNFIFTEIDSRLYNFTDDNLTKYNKINKIENFISEISL